MLLLSLDTCLSHILQFPEGNAMLPNTHDTQNWRLRNHDYLMAPLTAIDTID
jgi:hypothetical protein